MNFFHKTKRPVSAGRFVFYLLRGPDLHGRLKVMSPDKSGYFILLR